MTDDQARAIRAGFGRLAVEAGPRRIAVATTGASGVAYDVRAVELLHAMPEIETHLITMAGAR